jgi:CelD/BcsL family acetyltransferase involved in cellulose biosynthesis
MADCPIEEAQGVASALRFDRINPLADPRWPEFLYRQPRASVFHSPAWLRALRETYGYQPVVFTSSLPGQPLTDGVVFCEVKSWLVSPRLVSLPFSDHVEPLIADSHDRAGLLRHLKSEIRNGNWASVEFRPPGCSTNWRGFSEGQQYILHSLNLEPSLEALFRKLNKDSTQRKIRKAVRQQVRYEEGRSEELLQNFFRLVVLTRRRKSLPPPPLAWFRNVLRCLGDGVKIRIARTRAGELAGGILTLSFKDVMLFKYGASDARFHSLGTMPYLLWRAIEDAKKMGATAFDFGRSDFAHEGLIRFKDHFGTEQTPLSHRIFPGAAGQPASQDWKMRAASRVFATLPDSALILAGRLIYPHIG